MNARKTQIAQYAADRGPTAADRPAYDSSPDGLAFLVGLWARHRGIAVSEVCAGRGYKMRLNSTIVLDFCRALLAKIDQYDELQKWAVAEAAVEFWRHHISEETGAALRAVGLIGGAQ